MPRVPKGRLRMCVRSAVPSGLTPHWGCPPTLKRWAIIKCPSGTRTLRHFELQILIAWGETAGIAVLNRYRLLKGVSEGVVGLSAIFNSQFPIQNLDFAESSPIHILLKSPPHNFYRCCLSGPDFQGFRALIKEHTQPIGHSTARRL